MRAAIYARVSTDEQVEGYSLDAQLRACRQHCSDRGWQVVAEYVEEGRSARHEDLRRRPQFKAMLEAADSRAFDIVLVHKLDRFARNTLVLLTSLNRLGNAGVAFASVTEQQLDYSTPQGRLFLVMLGALAEWYSNNLSHETRKGKAERKAQGLYNGLLPFGVVKGDDGLPAPDRRDLGDGRTNYDGLQLAFRLAAEGRSDREIAVALNDAGYRTTGNRGANLWQKDTVRRMLVNRFYLGDLPDGRGGWLKGKHAPMLDVALFERVQAARQEHAAARASRCVPAGCRTYSLSGLLYCGHCLASSDPRRAKLHVNMVKASVYTRCSSRVQGIPCPQRGFPLSVFERQFEEWLVQIVIPDDAVEQALADLAREQREVSDQERERRQVEGRLARLKDLYQWGDLEREEYQRQRDELVAKLRLFQPVQRQRRDLERIAMFLRSVRATWQAASPTERNRLAGQLVQRIVVIDDQVAEIIPRPDVARWVPRWQPSLVTGGSDGIRTRDLSLDRAAC